MRAELRHSSGHASPEVWPDSFQGRSGHGETMINRIRAYDRRRKQSSAFPLLDPTWQFLKHPPLVIGVGELGQAAVERARTLRASHHSEDLLTAPLADADIRHAVTTL